MATTPGTGEQKAFEVYEIEVFQASRVKRWLYAVGALATSVISLVGAPTEFMALGNGYRIRDRLSGRTVTEFKPEISDYGDTWTILTDDLANLTAAEFAQRWC